MNLFRWLFSQPKYERIPDAYTFERQYLWPEVLKAIRFQQEQGETVWLITHFANQFFETQNRLGEWQIDYQVVSQSVSPQQTIELSQSKNGFVFLALADLLTPSEGGLKQSLSTVSLAMIAIERHPLIDHDNRLEQFIMQIPCRVKFGYYLALDDPPFEGIIGDSLVMLLRHFGMKEGELVNSIATTRSINRMLKKHSPGYNRSVRADSSAEWLALQKAAQRG